MQSQIEKTINLNMSIQTIFSKYPPNRPKDYLDKLYGKNDSECDKYYDSIFNYVIFEKPILK